jgi:hypothetical protein
MGFTDCKQAMIFLAGIAELHLPQPGDFDSTQLRPVNVPAASATTLIFPIEKGQAVHVRKIIVDFYTNTNYKFIVNGVLYEGDNELPFSIPQISREGTGGTIEIEIENLNATAISYSLRIEAWSRSV